MPMRSPRQCAVYLIEAATLGIGLIVSLVVFGLIGFGAGIGEPFSGLADVFVPMARASAIVGGGAIGIAGVVWTLVLARAGLGTAWCARFVHAEHRRCWAIGVAVLASIAFGTLGAATGIRDRSIDWIPTRPNLDQATAVIGAIGALALLLAGVVVRMVCLHFRRLGAAMEREIAEHCPRCWYPRTPTGTCPECGADTTASAAGDPANPGANAATNAQ